MLGGALDSEQGFDTYMGGLTVVSFFRICAHLDRRDRLVLVRPVDAFIFRRFRRFVGGSRSRSVVVVVGSMSHHSHVPNYVPRNFLPLHVVVVVVGS